MPALDEIAGILGQVISIPPISWLWYGGLSYVALGLAAIVGLGICGHRAVVRLVAAFGPPEDNEPADRGDPGLDWHHWGRRRDRGSLDVPDGSGSATDAAYPHLAHRADTIGTAPD